MSTLGYLLLAALPSAPANSVCVGEKVQLVGRYTLGFEASYVTPDAGAYHGRKIWIDDANAMAKLFSKSGSSKAWRRAEITAALCLKKGRSGSLALYDYSGRIERVIKFREM